MYVFAPLPRNPCISPPVCKLDYRDEHRICIETEEAANVKVGKGLGARGLGSRALLGGAWYSVTSRNWAHRLSHSRTYQYRSAQS